MIGDCDYFSRRAEEERKAAANTAHPNARQSHVDLADAYEKRARTLTAEERRSRIKVIKPA